MKRDPTSVQLLFVDAQTALVAASRTGTPKAINRASGVLATCAGMLALPLLFSAVRENGAPPVMLDALRGHASHDRVFLRDCASAFMDEALTAALAANNRRTLVIAGHASEVVVVHTALDAMALGYDVYLPLDAIGGLDPRTEAAVMRQIEAAGGSVGSVATLVTMLAPDFSRPPGAGILALLRNLS